MKYQGRGLSLLAQAPTWQAHGHEFDIGQKKKKNEILISERSEAWIIKRN